MGWAYYKLGDPEKAEEMFVEARNQAEKLGDVTDQVRWLTDTGYIYLDAGKFYAAEAVLSAVASTMRAKSTAEKTSSIPSAALAFVSEQTGKLDDAKRYADES